MQINSNHIGLLEIWKWNKFKIYRIFLLSIIVGGGRKAEGFPRSSKSPRLVLIFHFSASKWFNRSHSWCWKGLVGLVSSRKQLKSSRCEHVLRVHYFREAGSLGANNWTQRHHTFSLREVKSTKGSTLVLDGVESFNTWTYRK